MTLVAHKKLKYFPITPRLQRLFMSPNIVEHIKWHQSHDAVDKVIDGALFQQLRMKTL